MGFGIWGEPKRDSGQVLLLTFFLTVRPSGSPEARGAVMWAIQGSSRQVSLYRIGHSWETEEHRPDRVKRVS